MTVFIVRFIRSSRIPIDFPTPSSPWVFTSNTKNSFNMDAIVTLIGWWNEFCFTFQATLEKYIHQSMETSEEKKGCAESRGSLWIKRPKTTLGDSFLCVHVRNLNNCSCESVKMSLLFKKAHLKNEDIIVDDHIYCLIFDQVSMFFDQVHWFSMKVWWHDYLSLFGSRFHFLPSWNVW